MITKSEIYSLIGNFKYSQAAFCYYRMLERLSACVVSVCLMLILIAIFNLMNILGEFGTPLTDYKRLYFVIGLCVLVMGYFSILSSHCAAQRKYFEQMREIIMVFAIETVREKRFKRRVSNFIVQWTQMSGLLSGNRIGKLAKVYVRWKVGRVPQPDVFNHMPVVFDTQPTMYGEMSCPQS